uniref:Chitin-binding type-2 domain-containing protein n=1 Tax=Rhabditophanes sp. KR3021 TaxID=114890 RepID=A0AC35U308_9BILA
MVKITASLLAILIVSVSSQATSPVSGTPVIGGACKLGLADVQIGGKQTQFFLKCESNTDSGDGQGVWVVKSRSATTATAAPVTQAETRETSSDTIPKTMSKVGLAQPTICEQDNTAKFNEKCSSPVTCLQANYLEKNTFLQCDDTSKTWTKKYCKDSNSYFSFENQACLGGERPGAKRKWFEYDNGNKSQDQTSQHQNLILASINDLTGHNLVRTTQSVETGTFLKNDSIFEIEKTYATNKSFLTNSQLTPPTCHSKKLCSEPLNLCGVNEKCNLATRCCHIVKCPGTNDLPLAFPDYCTSIYNCPANTDCVSGKCCQKEKVEKNENRDEKYDTEQTNELSFERALSRHNISRSFFLNSIDTSKTDTELFDKFECEIDPLAAESCSIQEPCPDDSICISHRCCIRPSTSICDNGLYSLSIPKFCERDDNCGSTAKCEKQRCCPLELSQLTSTPSTTTMLSMIQNNIKNKTSSTIENKPKITENRNAMPSIAPFPTLPSNNTITESFEIVTNGSDILPVALTPKNPFEEVPESFLIDNATLIPAPGRLLTPEEEYNRRQCPGGREALSTPISCLVNDDCAFGYECVTNLCCIPALNDEYKDNFEKKLNETKLDLEYINVKNFYDKSNKDNADVKNAKDDDLQTDNILFNLKKIDENQPMLQMAEVEDTNNTNKQQSTLTAMKSTKEEKTLLFGNSRYY